MLKTYTVATDFTDGSKGKIEGLTEGDVIVTLEGTLANIGFHSLTITPDAVEN